VDGYKGLRGGARAWDRRRRRVGVLALRVLAGMKF